MFFTLLALPTTKANAGIISSIFGSEVYADISALNLEQSTNNSQTMALLQPNISAIPIFQDKNSKESMVDKNASILVSDNALLPTTSPQTALGVKEDTDFSPDQVSVYVVRAGDTISQVATMFDVSVNTILVANDMKKGEKLVLGDTLFILPISGLEHTVAKGQTLKSIAANYKVDVADIAFYNDITENSVLVVGDKLIIPGGEMIDEGSDKPAPNLAAVEARDKQYYDTHPIIKNAAGYFINPLPAGRKTQGRHGPGLRGIDIGAPTGTPIYASASGTVLAVKAGCAVGRKSCGGGYGNMAIIQHPNGTKTLYAHMSKLATSTGTNVKQGKVIGYVGSTGRSTGPHLHFEVFNAKNPGADWSWKK